MSGPTRWETPSRWEPEELLTIWNQRDHLARTESAELALCGAAAGPAQPPSWEPADGGLRACPQCHREAFQHGVIWRGDDCLVSAVRIGSNRARPA